MNAVKILVVEDELLIGRNIELFLRKMEYEVTGIATSYTEAIELIEQDTPDLVLLDIYLSGSKTGIDIGALLNSQYEIPFIFLTSYEDSDTLNKAKAVQPSAYLTKPYREKELFAAIEIAIMNYAAKKEGTFAEPKPEAENVLVKDSIFLYLKNTYKKVMVENILWLKGEGSYTSVSTKTGKFLVRGYLKDFLGIKVMEDFYRVQKSYVVNLRKVDEIHTDHILVGGEEIPITKEVRSELINRFPTLF